MLTPIGKKVLGFILVIVGAVLTTLVLSSGGVYYRLTLTIGSVLVGLVLTWWGHLSKE